MAVPRMTCGGCGAEISPGDETCSRCGVNIEYPGGGQQESPRGGVCPSCGHRNAGKGAFCESCGKQMKTGAQKGAGESRTRTARHKKLISGSHMPAIVVAVLFSGWVVYSEMEREIPPREEHDHSLPATGKASDPEIERLQKLVEEFPDDDENLLRLANLLQDHSSEDPNNLVRAITTYQKYLSRNPGNENARVDLGICYFEMSRTDTVHGTALLDRAIAEIGTVAEANPRHQAAAFNLGIVALNVGRTEEAAEWFERTVEIDPASDLGARAKRLLAQHASPSPTQ